MIIDSLSHRQQYQAVSLDIALVLEHLATTDYSQCPEGRYPIDGERIFAIVSDYQPIMPEQSYFEIHREYIDVQFIVNGYESIGWLPLVEQKLEIHYQPEMDVAKFPPEPLLEKASFMGLTTGMFAIFFPQDIHMPAVIPSSESVRKVVVKIKIQ